MSVPLEPRHVVDTAARLRRRVGERFPASGLEKIAASLVALAEGADARGREIARPHLPLRGAVWLLTGALLAGLAATFLRVSAAPGYASLADLLQGVDAAANIVLLLGAGVLSLSRLEDSIRRRKALALVHELKELAHVIDMHQLTKDPETISVEAPRTESSPKRAMSRWELGRYLDYSSEMLSLLGKIGAIYDRRLQDAVVLEAIDGAEDLFTGLSRKIWQKIAILGETSPKA